MTLAKMLIGCLVGGSVIVATYAGEPVRVTTYKKELVTEYLQQTVTTYETVWVEEQRERRYTVARQVPETSTRQERTTVQKPVWETQYRDESYDVTRYVPETSEREERYVVPRQVYETREREVIENRQVPVQETVLRENRYTVHKPVTTYETQVVDRGQTVETIRAQAPQNYTRLVWQRAGDQYDPATGTTRWQAPGFRWKELAGDTTYQVQKTYRPNWVQELRPVTTTVSEQIVEQIPVTQTTYRTEQVARTETVQVPVTVQDEVVQRVPVTTYKPIVERVEKKIPVQVCRYETEEVVREVPVTTYKTIYEEVVEPYTVRVAKKVPVTKTLQKPVQVERLIPIASTSTLPISSSTTYAAPSSSLSSLPRTNVQRIETRIIAPSEPIVPLTDLFISRPTSITPAPISPSRDPADSTPVLQN